MPTRKTPFRSDADPNRLPPGTALNGGKYRVLSLIARGGMGHVYLAVQAPIERRVALKVLRTPPGTDAAMEEKFRARFFREASILARLQHANVVTLYDYGRIDGEPERYFMAMEYLDGSTLARRIRERTALGAQETLRVVHQMARGLREAHKLGAVHRDLKPSNVMIVPDGDDGEIVKILDFGIGKLTGDGVEEITTESQFLGSPRYMAPEQVNDRLVDARTDVYALGVIAYECLTGHVPFERDSHAETLLAHRNAPVPPMAEIAPGVNVPPIVEGLVRRCLEKAPAQRLQSMEEVLRAVAGCEQALFGATGLGPTASRPSFARISSAEAMAAWTEAHATRTSTVPPPPPPAHVEKSHTSLALHVIVTAAVFAGIVGLIERDRVMALATKAEGALAAAVAASASPALQPPSFELDLESTPQGAEVQEDGQMVGTTPMKATIDRATVQQAPRRFVLLRDGYLPYTLRQGDSKVAVDVVAKLLPAPPPPGAPVVGKPRP